MKKTPQIFITFIVLFISYVFISCNNAPENPFPRIIQEEDTEELEKLIANEGVNNYYKSQSPLRYAIQTNNLRAVKFLIEKGADVNLDGVSCDSLTKWLECSQHKKPLHISIEKGNKEIVNILIKNGADVNAKDIHGETPLMYAAKEGHTEIINLLKSAGAKNDILTAVLTQDLQSVKEFIEKGADLNKRYNIEEKLENGNIISGNPNLLSIAKEKSSPEIVELLITNGAKADSLDFFTEEK